MIDLECCEDCLMYLANGVEPEPPRLPRAPLIRARWPTGWLYPTDPTTTFSSAPCDACGETSGGSRHGFCVLTSRSPWITNKGDQEPPHPLVIDRITKLGRLATQSDVSRMEAICVAYEAVLRDFEERLRLADLLRGQLENTYGR